MDDHIGGLASFQIVGLSGTALADSPLRWLHGIRSLVFFIVGIKVFFLWFGASSLSVGRSRSLLPEKSISSQNTITKDRVGDQQGENDGEGNDGQIPSQRENVRELPVDQIESDSHSEHHKGQDVEESNKLEGSRFFSNTIEIQKGARVKENGIDLHQQSQSGHSKELCGEDGCAEAGNDHNVMEQELQNADGTFVDEQVDEIMDNITKGNVNLKNMINIFKNNVKYVLDRS